MALWWIVNDVAGETEVFVQEADTLIGARLRASIDGFKGTFSEGHMLDAKTTKKMPKDLVGRMLNQRQAMRLLKRLG